MAVRSLSLSLEPPKPRHLRLVGRGVVTADSLYGGPQAARPQWGLGEVRGRLVELSAPAGRGARLTLAMALIRETLREGEPAAWIAASRETFHPPDAAEAGVPLEALPVVRVTGTRAAARAASQLIRSGGFGLVVLDLEARASLPMPLCSRLVKLAQKHSTGVLFLTEKDDGEPSLGSLVSLRATTRLELQRIAGEAGLRFRATLVALKDKRRAPGWSDSEVFRGPRGLR